MAKLYNDNRFLANYTQHQNILGVISKQNDEFSEEFKDLVIRMLAYNYNERPSLEQI